MAFPKRAGVRPQTARVRRTHGGYSCPACQNPMSVIDTRTIPEGVRRRRECPKCAARLTTYETEVYVREIDGLISTAASLTSALIRLKRVNPE